MARIALGVLSLAILLGGLGCTWTETYNEFPPTAAGGNSAHHHHDHGHPHQVQVKE